MTIVAAGGGSGGHVTPVSAVLRELKRHDQNLKAYFITDHAFGAQASAMMGKLPFKVSVKRIHAGKIRRYHNVSIWRHVADISMMAKNLRDLFLVGVGFGQSLWLFYRVKPDVVFTKGGFVCLPVGLAARVLGIPLVIHDSDAHPGLTNRVLSKYAAAIATGAPVENYPYPKERTRYIGIPVDGAYRPLTAAQRQKCKELLGLTDIKKPLLVVTGGGLGARNLNHAVVSVAPQLLEKMAIVHITGQSNYHETLNQAVEHVDYIIKPFLPEGMAVAFGAADVVVTRAGASTMGELAGSARPVIIVPNPLLTGGHQLKNAAIYEKSGAAVVLDEDELILNPLKLKHTITNLMKDSKKRQAMIKAINGFAKPDAAIDMAELIVAAAYEHKRKAKKTKGKS